MWEPLLKRSLFLSPHVKWRWTYFYFLLRHADSSLLTSCWLYYYWTLLIMKTVLKAGLVFIKNGKMYYLKLPIVAVTKTPFLEFILFNFEHFYLLNGTYWWDLIQFLCPNDHFWPYFSILGIYFTDSAKKMTLTQKWLRSTIYTKKMVKSVLFVLLSRFQS